MKIKTKVPVEVLPNLPAWYKWISPAFLQQFLFFFIPGFIDGSVSYITIAIGCFPGFAPDFILSCCCR
jgi:RNase adaptor protein for sRNA GlmZ degradation